MSNIYNLEPLTNGKVLLTTSHGDLEIELWAKEVPKACRNFVQLCLEGYYDTVIFHRLVKDFVIQGGDPTGTGRGGASIYGAEFKDEFHQRLKYTRRGLVGMANSGTPDSNTSQFFITLAETPELQKKNTIFGKVSGNTIYNILRMAELEVDGDDRPLEPPFIKKCEVLNNPFDDIIVRDIQHHAPKEEKKKKKKSQMKGTKNFKLLSFGDEAEEDEGEVQQASASFKLVSCHDTGQDPKLSTEVAVSEEQLKLDRITIEEQAKSIKEKLKKELTVVKAPDKLTTEKEKRLGGLKEESEQLLQEIKGIGKEGPAAVEANKPNRDDDLAPEERATVNDFRKTLKETKLSTNAKVQKLSKGAREKQTLEYLANFTKQSVVLEEDEEKEEVLLPEEIEGDEEEEMLNNFNLFTHSLVSADSKAKVKDANVVDEDTYEIYDPRHPINKRKREKDKKKGNEDGGTWKRNKMLL